MRTRRDLWHAKEQHRVGALSGFRPMLLYRLENWSSMLQMTECSQICTRNRSILITYSSSCTVLLVSQLKQYPSESSYADVEAAEGVEGYMILVTVLFSNVSQY